MSTLLSDGSYCCKRLTEGNFFFFQNWPAWGWWSPIDFHVFAMLPLPGIKIAQLYFLQTDYKKSDKKFKIQCSYWHSLSPDTLSLAQHWNSLHNLYFSQSPNKFLILLLTLSVFFFYCECDWPRGSDHDSQSPITVWSWIWFTDWANLKEFATWLSESGHTAYDRARMLKLRGLGQKARYKRFL